LQQARPSHPVAIRRLALAVVIVALLVRTTIGAVVGLDGDEAYYAMWSVWLAPGYLDHPPGVALFIAAGRLLLSDTYLGVRLFALLASLATTVALYRIARLLLPQPEAPALVVIWYTLTLTVGISFVATPDAPSTLFWTLALWSAAEAISGRRPGWWLAVGLFAGLGLVSKYTNAWLGIGLALYLVATPAGRAELCRWQPWAGGLLALAVFSPVLWWNAVREWRSFLFQGMRVVSVEDLSGRSILESLAGQFLVAGPILVVATALGLGWYALRGRRTAPGLALPVLTTLPVLAYFAVHSLHSKVEANWLQPVLPAMTLIGTGWLLTAVSRRWLRVTLLVGQAVFGLLLVGFVSIQALLHPFDLRDLDRTRHLRGWAELSASVRQLADEVDARAIYTMGQYQLTGELFFHGRAAGDPRPVRDIAQPVRYEFIPAPERRPRLFPAVVVVPSGRQPAPTLDGGYFAQSRLLGRLLRGAPADSPSAYAVYAVEAAGPAFPDE